MKNYCIAVFLTVLVSGANPFYLQNRQTDVISGTWRGSSICQDKSSACHDEIAVYHASKAAGQNVYLFQMNKMVNGQETEMGPLNFVYNDTLKTLTAIDNFRGTKHTWSFKINGTTMHGTLTLDNARVFRVIDLKKDS